MLGVLANTETGESHCWQGSHKLEELIRRLDRHTEIRSAQVFVWINKTLSCKGARLRKTKSKWLGENFLCSSNWVKKLPVLKPVQPAAPGTAQQVQEEKGQSSKTRRAIITQERGIKLFFHLRGCSSHIVNTLHLEDCTLASLRKRFEGKMCSYTIRSIVFDTYLKTFGILFQPGKHVWGIMKMLNKSLK